MTETLVRFSVGPHSCAMPIEAVQEVLRIVAVTPLPRAPKFVEGVINLRGVVTPVLDLRRRFGLEAPAADSSTRILIARLGRTAAGLIVDDVTDVSAIDAESRGIDPTEALGINLRQYASRVVQVDGSLVIVIDPATLLTDAEVAAVEAAATEEESDAGQA